MNFLNMKSDVLLLPGNTDMFDNRSWYYNDQNMKEFHHAVISGMSSSSPMHNDEISFEHFNPPTDNMESPSSARASPDSSLHRRNGSNRSFSKKEKSKKSRSSKQSPASEEDTPEDKSMRRREQNRIAQRTFRERKDRYIQNLESHIKMLDASHQDLQASYKQSTDQLNALYTQLIETQGELDYWRCLAQPSTTPTSAPTAIGTSPLPSPMTMHPHLSTSRTMSPVEPHNMHTSVSTRHHIPVMPGMHIQHGQYT